MLSRDVKVPRRSTPVLGNLEIMSKIQNTRNPRRQLENVCHFPRCPRHTSEGKPFCADHIGHMPAVQEISRELEVRDIEMAAVLGMGWIAVDIEGTRSQEVVTALTVHGTLSYERLRQLVFQDEPEREIVDPVFQGYLEALRRAGVLVIESRGSRRGGIKLMVRLT